MQFGAVYRAHFSRVWRTIRRLGIADKDALDATQEVFLIAHRQWDRFEGRSTVATWLYGIAYRVAADRRRSAPVRRERLYGDIGPDLGSVRDPLEELESRDLMRLLDRILDNLPLEQRAVFTMFEMEGLNGEEIASALGIPLGTVRSRLRLARESFKRTLSQQSRADPFNARGGA